MHGHSSYEEVQLKDPEPEYSYAAHGVDMNTYDSVAHDENGGCYGNTNEQVHVVDNTACPVFTVWGDTGEWNVLKTGPKVMYSKLDQKSK